MIEFTLSESEESRVRVVHGDMAVVMRTVVDVVSPATCTYDQLKDWLGTFAVKNQEGHWEVRNDPVLGDFDSWDHEFETLLSEVASWLCERGLSITDSPAYRWD